MTTQRYIYFGIATQKLQKKLKKPCFREAPIFYVAVNQSVLPTCNKIDDKLHKDIRLITDNLIAVIGLYYSLKITYCINSLVHYE